MPSRKQFNGTISEELSTVFLFCLFRSDQPEKSENQTVLKKNWAAPFWQTRAANRRGCFSTCSHAARSLLFHHAPLLPPRCPYAALSLWRMATQRKRRRKAQTLWAPFSPLAAAGLDCSSWEGGGCCGCEISPRQAFSGVRPVGRSAIKKVQLRASRLLPSKRTGKGIRKARRSCSFCACSRGRGKFFFSLEEAESGWWKMFLMHCTF